MSRRYWRRWACRAKGCGFVYVHPIGGASEAWHKCPKRDGRITALRGVGRAVTS